MKKIFKYFIFFVCVSSNIYCAMSSIDCKNIRECMEETLNDILQDNRLNSGIKARACELLEFDLTKDVNYTESFFLYTYCQLDFETFSYVKLKNTEDNNLNNQEKSNIKLQFKKWLYEYYLDEAASDLGLKTPVLIRWPEPVRDLSKNSGKNDSTDSDFNTLVKFKNQLREIYKEFVN